MISRETYDAALISGPAVVVKKQKRSRPADSVADLRRALVVSERTVAVLQKALRETVDRAAQREVDAARASELRDLKQAELDRAERRLAESKEAQKEAEELRRRALLLINALGR